jgi:hypothetical protein
MKTKYKHGETFIKRGRVLIYLKGRRYQEYSRYLWKQVCGEIPNGYVIHHKDFNPLNNTIENLEIMTEAKHKSLHHYGKTISEESRRKMSEAKKGNTYRRGSKHTEEAKAKMGLANVGREPANKGKKMSDEQKEKLRQKAKAQFASDEARQKHSEIMKKHYGK